MCFIDAPHYVKDPKYGNRWSLYQNVACFLCNKKDVTEVEYVCDEWNTGRTLGTTNLFDVLDLSISRTNPNEIENRHWNCHEWEIFDSIMVFINMHYFKYYIRLIVTQNVRALAYSSKYRSFDNE